MAAYYTALEEAAGENLRGDIESADRHDLLAQLAVENQEYSSSPVNESPTAVLVALDITNNCGCDQGEQDDQADQPTPHQKLEQRRSGLIKEVVDNIEKSPDATVQSLPKDQATAIRKDLVTVQILGGDKGLKEFVDDVNKQLHSQILIAPVDPPGPFHSGAIILTPDGYTRYGGGFRLEKKSQ